MGDTQSDGTPWVMDESRCGDFPECHAEPPTCDHGKVLALVVQPDGHAALTKTRTDLASVRALIGGGYLEGVSGEYGKWTAYGDGEGRLKGMEPNGTASVLALELGGYADMLVGTVVFFGLTMEDPEEGFVETDLPPELLEIANRVVFLEQ